MPVSPAVQHGIDFLGEVEHWARIQEKLEQMDPLSVAATGRLASGWFITQQVTGPGAQLACPVIGVV
jgi:hypothetical protein